MKDVYEEPCELTIIAYMSGVADQREKNRSTLTSILDIIERRDDPVKKLYEIKDIIEKNQINL